MRRSGTGRAVPADWTARINDESDLEAHLARLPDEPGVYIMRDRNGEVVYVGKARRLRVRVRQYFSGHDTRHFVPLLAKLVGDIETVVTENEKEALLLENNLIKRHRPRFNVKLRDDKNYLLLRLDPSASWPRLELVRRIRRDGAQYFGPYHSATSARSTLRVVNRHFQLRTCTDYALTRRSRPCLQYQIGRCPAPCVLEVDRTTYGEQVRDVGLFLAGRHGELLTGLRGRMTHAASALDFETAARLRDQVASIETTLQSQRVVGTGDTDQDAVGMYREGGQVDFVVLQIRGGKLLGTHSFSERGMELPSAEVLANFLISYYDSPTSPPDEILLPHAIDEEDASPLTSWLRDRKGSKVVVSTPERGPRRKLVALADRNAAANFVSRRNRRHDSDQALTRLRDRLGLSRLPRRIECFDVSHIQGREVVASMVVFEDGVAAKSLYRSFKVRGDSQRVGSDDPGDSNRFHNDDFASMYEILGRRFRRAIEAKDSDEWELPDLVVIDGGKGQLSRVLAVMQDLGIALGAEGVDVVALAKERRHGLGRGRQALETFKAMRRSVDEHESDTDPGASYRSWQVKFENERDEAVVIRPERVYVPGVKDPISLRPGCSERHLMEQIRDEAHRFAIQHHRKRRSRQALRSKLDDIEGVGPALRRALIKHFGSVAAIRRAELAALQQVKGVGPALATRIHEALHVEGQAPVSD